VYEKSDNAVHSEHAAGRTEKIILNAFHVDPEKGQSQKTIP